MPRTFCIFFFFFFAFSEYSKAEVSRDQCKKIVSLAPSITESIYALGLGVNLVGRTRFCNYPSEVLSLPSVGGFLDPSLETIIRLQPTIVVLLKEQRSLSDNLLKLGLKTIVVDQSGVNAILDSLESIGEYCGNKEDADALVNKLKSEITEVKERLKDVKKVRTLVTVGRGETGSGSSVYASGKDGYYNDLLELAGGENVNTGITMGFPIISQEGLMSVNPEAIIEIIMPGAIKKQQLNPANVWHQMHSLDAVKNNKILFTDENYASIPGPRFTKLLKDFAKFLHPDKF